MHCLTATDIAFVPTTFLTHVLCLEEQWLKTTAVKTQHRLFQSLKVEYKQQS